MVASLEVLLPCSYRVYFLDEIHFNGEDADSSFRDQLEQEYYSSREEQEEESSSLLANLGTHDRLSAFVIDALLCRLRWNFFLASFPQRNRF